MSKPQVFSEEEKESFRAAINRMRQRGAYEPGKWVVSPLNRDPAVVGELPSFVRLRDITLRTTEQMPGVVATEQDRRAFLSKIVNVGVPEVQTSTFKRGHTLDDMRAEIAAVKRVNPDCAVSYGEVSSVEEIELGAQVGYDNVQFWAAPWADAAPMYTGGVYVAAWQGKDWRQLKFPRTREEQISRARQLIQAGRGAGIEVSAGVNMLPYASQEYVSEYCRAVAEAGASEIVLYDGPSGVGPEAYAHLVRLAKEAAPGIPIGVHAHNMFDLGVACCISAARAGAEVLEVSVNGYCAASGQADLAAVTMALNALYGVPTGVRLSELTELARYGEAFTGYKLAWNHPVTGEQVFNWGGMESIIQELEIDPLVHWCIEPSIVGNQRRWGITRDSGPYTMWDKLDQLGVEVSEKEEVEAILRRCLDAIHDRRRPITDEEVRAIAGAVKASAAQPT